DAPNIDLQQAGRAMGVNTIVTGHFLKQGDQLQVTLEAVDVANNRSVWRDTMNASLQDKIALKQEITSRIQHSLVPVLGGSLRSEESGTLPTNQQAYDLFLRSVAIPHDPIPNREAISMLERATGMDPTYAAIW